MRLRVGACRDVDHERFIGASDTALDGQDIIVSGATLTVAGSHRFASLRLMQGATLTHPAATQGQATNAIRLVIIGDVTVDAASRINADGLGYAEASSPGAGTRGVFAASGGGHGGDGGMSGGVPAGTSGRGFGSIAAPDEWGGPGGPDDLRYAYVANLNGQWLFGPEASAEPVLRPIIEVPPAEEDPPSPVAPQMPPARIPGDGIRKTWFVEIHIADYSNTANANLPNVRKDSSDLRTFLRHDLRVPSEQHTGGLDQVGDGASWNRENVINALREFRGKIDADDNLVISYSGHGGRTQNGTGYMALNGGYLSPAAFTRIIDEIGAGTTYLVNDSCHSESFNDRVSPANTTFVGFAASKSGRVAWDDPAKGGYLLSGLKEKLRACNTLGHSMELTTQAVADHFKNRAQLKHRQHPVLSNSSGANLDGKMWTDPAGIEQEIRRRLNRLAFRPLISRGLNIAGSIDPNDKYALAGSGPERWVNPAQTLPFEVVFENKTNAAAPAQEILVVDNLDPRLDWSTLELRSIAFNDVRLTVPPGLQRFTATARVGGDPNDVTIETAFNPATGRITWLLRSRDVLTGGLPEDPFAGFLPPNDAAHRGEGSLSFTVRPKSGLPNGTELTNRATIIFDPTYGANPPIVTP